MRNYEPSFLLQSSESPLVAINLREIVNLKVFNSLSLDERDRLLPYLSWIDRRSIESIDAMFSSNTFLSDISLYQAMLEAGEFENWEENEFLSGAATSCSNTSSEIITMDANKTEKIISKPQQQAKRKRNKEFVDPWKEKYFEDYWGQKRMKTLQSSEWKEEEEPEQQKTSFSFVEYANQFPEKIKYTELWKPEPASVMMQIPNQPQRIPKSIIEVTEKASRNGNGYPSEMERDFPSENGGEYALARIPVSSRRKRRKLMEQPEESSNEKEPNLLRTIVSDSSNTINTNDSSSDLLDSKVPNRKSNPKPIKWKERSSTATSGKSFRHCAYTILKRLGKPLSAKAIVSIGLKEGLISTSGKTPQNTLASLIYCEMKKDPNSVFMKAGPMMFGLKEFDSKPLDCVHSENNRRESFVEEGDTEDLP